MIFNLIIKLFFWFFVGDEYVLKMRFLDHIFDDMAVEHLEVKIILPEGTRNIEIKYE